MFCIKCGNQIGDSDKLCPKCGSPVNNVTDAGNTNNASADPVITKPKKKFIPLIILAVVLVAVISVVSVIVVVSSSPARRYEKQLNLGYRYFEELDYESAIAAFEAAIKIEPKNIDAYEGLAEVYLELEDYDELVDVYERASDNLDPDDLDDLRDMMVDELSDLVEDAYDDQKFDQMTELIGILYDIDEDAAEKCEEEFMTIETDVTDVDPVEDDPDDLIVEDDEPDESGEQYELVDGVARHLYSDHNIDSSDESFFDNIISATNANSKERLLEIICSSEIQSILEKYTGDNSFDYYYENNDGPDEYSISAEGYFLYKNYKIFLSVDIWRSSEYDIEDDDRMIVCIPLDNSNGICLVYGLDASISDDSDWLKTVDYGTCPCRDGMFNGYAYVTNEEFTGAGEKGLSEYEGNVVNGLRDGIWDLEFSSTHSDGETWYGGGEPEYSNGVDLGGWYSEDLKFDIVDYWYEEIVDGGIIVYPY